MGLGLCGLSLLPIEVLRNAYCRFITKVASALEIGPPAMSLTRFSLFALNFVAIALYNL